MVVSHISRPDTLHFHTLFRHLNSIFDLEQDKIFVPVYELQILLPELLMEFIQEILGISQVQTSLGDSDHPDDMRNPQRS